MDIFWYYLLAILSFSIVGIINLYLIKTKDIIRELPPLIFPNTGNMGLPICMFAYGSQGLGVSASITSLIILMHFTVGVFLADRKFNLDVIIKNPPFYAIIFSAVIFSLFHYLGPFGDNFSYKSFYLRTLAGIFLGSLYIFRGFGITVYTHIFYDMFIISMPIIFIPA